jgi:hypothetical protein
LTWLSPPKISFGKGQNPATPSLFRARRRRLHIGGINPSRPTLTPLVSNEPSGSFFMDCDERMKKP